MARSVWRKIEGKKMVGQKDFLVEGEIELLMNVHGALIEKPSKQYKPIDAPKF